jgi:hypothetical protein
VSTATTATLTSGAEKYEGEVIVGLTVDEARGQFADAFGISPSANAFVNGRAVTGDYVVEANDDLAFTTATGQKG